MVKPGLFRMTWENGLEYAEGRGKAWRGVVGWKRFGWEFCKVFLRWECRFSPKDHSNALVLVFMLKRSGDKAPLERSMMFVWALLMWRFFLQNDLVRDLLRPRVSLFSTEARAIRFQIKFTASFLVFAFGWP